MPRPTPLPGRAALKLWSARFLSISSLSAAHGKNRKPIRFRAVDLHNARPFTGNHRLLLVPRVALDLFSAFPDRFVFGKTRTLSSRRICRAAIGFLLLPSTPHRPASPPPRRFFGNALSRSKKFWWRALCSPVGPLPLAASGFFCTLADAAVTSREEVPPDPLTGDPLSVPPTLSRAAPGSTDFPLRTTATWKPFTMYPFLPPSLPPRPEFDPQRQLPRGSVLAFLSHRAEVGPSIVRR